MSTSDRTPKPRRHWLRRVVDVLWLLVIGVAAWFVWPTTLGGHTRLITVEGRSMEPTYHLGDVVVTRSNPHPHVGDIIVYHIPKGFPASGLLIVHRVHAVRPDGTYETKGDNRTLPDQFHIASADIVGTPVMVLPEFARVLALTTSPTAVGVTTGIIVTIYMWPRKRKPGDDEEPGEDHESGEGGGPEQPDTSAAVGQPSRIAAQLERLAAEDTAVQARLDQIEADAIAWLEEQLGIGTVRA